MSNTAVSFVMPIKNAAPFIGDALSWLSRPEIITLGKSIEVILVDDSSSDELCSALEKVRDPVGVIRYVISPGSGQVSALNYGYSLSRGRSIKFIDADDVLECAWFALTEAWKHGGNGRWAEVHGGKIVDVRLKPIAIYRPPSFENRDEAFENLASVPRWSWCVSRGLCDKIFPLPAELPFADVWMAAATVRWAQSIHVIASPVYLYRQHGHQTYGGTLNFSKEVVTFRCRRMEKVISCMISHADHFDMNEAEASQVLRQQADYWRRLQDYDAGTFAVLKSRLPARLKMKILLQQRTPRLCGCVVRMKWFWDGLRDYV
ncbi:MAG: glycosyltransferase family 2 protein [Gammaproteobacteria bacterium]